MGDPADAASSTAVTPPTAEPLVAAESAGRRPPSDPRSDGRLLADVAGLDQLVREREAVWKGLAQALDAVRRQVTLAGVEAQKSRSRGSHQAAQGGGPGQARPPAPTGDEVSARNLMRQFETTQRETEERRVALHAEMEELRQRRQALLRRLPAPVSRAYRSLADAGRVPAIAAVAEATCSGCQSPVPASVTELLTHGAVTACARCERLLHLARPLA